MKYIDSTAKTNWKFIVIVVIFMLTAVGGILLLKEMQSMSNAPTVLQPQEMDKASWQVYPNEELGFKLKYPETFMQWEEYPSETLPRTISFHRKIINGFEFRGLYISVSDRREHAQYWQGNDPVKTLKDYADQTTQAHQNRVFDEEERKVVVSKALIDEKDAIKITYGNGIDLIYLGGEPSPSHSGPIEYTTLVNGKFYTIEYHTDDKVMLELYDKILSTFRFVDK